MNSQDISALTRSLAVEGQRITRPITPLDISTMADKLQLLGAKASAAAIRTLWDEVCIARQKAAEAERIIEAERTRKRSVCERVTAFFNKEVK